MHIEYLGNFQRYGLLSVYELQNAGLPSNIYMSLQTESDVSVPITPLCTVNQMSNEDFAAALPEPTLQVYKSFTINKYRVYTDKTIDDAIIYAHYGLIRAGGVQFTLVDMVASDKSDYLYMLDFYAIDIPNAFIVAKDVLQPYSLVQPLSFDMANYVNGHRESLEVTKNTNAYAKLLTKMSLVGNDLTIACQDAAGVSAATHIARVLNIAEESVVITCKVQVIGIDNAGNKVFNYEIIAANGDYGDSPMHVILPGLPDKAVAAQVSIDYIASLQTIGETLHLYDKMILTDEQVVMLHPLSAIDVSNGFATLFRLFDGDGAPLANAVLNINGVNYTSDINGLISLNLMPGSYPYSLTYNGVTKYATLTVGMSMTVQIVFNVVQLDMQVHVVGTDDCPLTGMEITVDGSTTMTTDANGNITLRSLQGRIFTLSAELGQIVHQKQLANNGATQILRIYNSFDDEVVLEDVLS
jgi:hypothetical protein